jgi:NAD(P)H-hydrate epimerase
MKERFTSAKDVERVLKKREKNSFKGQNGVVLVVGGSRNLVGAPFLAGMSALRSGVDLVKVFCPERVGFALNSLSPDLISIKAKGEFLEKKHLSEALELSTKADCVLLGPGICLHPKTRKFVKGFVKECGKRIVVDADALKVLKGVDLSNCLVTPHAKEFELLFGEKVSLDLKERILFSKKMAREHNTTIVLKGAVDVIADSKQLKLNKTGNPGMTVGGTGDILSGLSAGFLAQSGKVFESACAAAFVCGKAGDLARKEFGFGFIASDLLGFLHKVIPKE